MSPFVSDLVFQFGAIAIVVFLNGVDAGWILGRKSSLLEQGKDFGQSVVSGEGLDIFEELGFRDADEWISDSEEIQ